MDDEWVVKKLWALDAHTMRCRSLMLESLLPFGTDPPSSVVSMITTVQKFARGSLARAQARQLRAIREALRSWIFHTERMRAAELIKIHMMHEHSAGVIQRTFRVFLRRWTRPRVSELLRRLEKEELRVTRRKRNRIVVSSVACQTHDHFVPHEEKKCLAY